MRCPRCGNKMITRWKTTLKGKLFNKKKFWVDVEVEYRRKLCPKCKLMFTTYEIQREELLKLFRRIEGEKEERNEHMGET